MISFQLFVSAMPKKLCISENFTSGKGVQNSKEFILISSTMLFLIWNELHIISELFVGRS
jgi:hypothetical protein